MSSPMTPLERAIATIELNQQTLRHLKRKTKLDEATARLVEMTQNTNRALLADLANEPQKGEVHDVKQA